MLLEGGGEWQKEKRISVIAADAGRHSRIRFYLSDISATDLLILVTGEVQGILVRRPDIWYRRKMIEDINILPYFASEIINNNLIQRFN